MTPNFGLEIRNIEPNQENYSRKLGKSFSISGKFLLNIKKIHPQKVKVLVFYCLNLQKDIYSHHMMSFHICGIYILWWRPIIFVDIIRIVYDFCTPSYLDPHWPAGSLRSKHMMHNHHKMESHLMMESHHIIIWWKVIIFVK